MRTSHVFSGIDKRYMPDPRWRDTGQGDDNTSQSR